MRPRRSRPDPQEAPRLARETALKLLARREHSSGELRAKLAARSFPTEAIEQALAQLQARRLLDDARFAEAFVRQRAEAGYGPLRIRAELRERGVGDPLAGEALAAYADEWRSRGGAARRRRFGAGPPADRSEWLRQARYLSRRGFPEALVRELMDAADDAA